MPAAEAAREAAGAGRVPAGTAAPAVGVARVTIPITLPMRLPSSV